MMQSNKNKLKYNIFIFYPLQNNIQHIATKAKKQNKLTNLLQSDIIPSMKLLIEYIKLILTMMLYGLITIAVMAGIFAIFVIIFSIQTLL